MKRDEIALLLPEIFRRTLQPYKVDLQPSVLWALLGVMERLQGPDEKLLEALDWYFDPYQVPPARAAQFLPFLARWVDLDWLLLEGQARELNPDCLRNLIMDAPRLAALRGTRQGLKQFLETATGVPGFQVSEDPDKPFTIIITCPAEAEPFRTLVERIVAGEKPAYVKCELKPPRPGLTGRPGRSMEGYHDKSRNDF